MEKSFSDQDIANGLVKSKTGINGLDEVLDGGFPVGRSTLICGAAGCGKTLMACEFLVHGATLFDEPGVFIAFEETPEEMAQNLASLGIDLNQLIAEKKIFVDYVKVDRSEIEETGEYDLEGLYIRLANAIQTVGAKRVVLDTVEAIFTGFANESILRSELRRLFRWLKDRGLTAVITAERGQGMITRHGLEEYVSDCVILLENHMREGIATRTLRVVKYRGSRHGNNEYPFLIDQSGIWVMPITSVGLDYPISHDFISTGIPRLDTMLNGHGYYRGSSVLLSGTAGTGKTILASHLADATCRNGERCLLIAFEESAGHIMRNVASAGIDLRQWLDQGLLHFHTARPSLLGAELHLLTIHKLVTEFQPSVVIMDPITNLVQIASLFEVKSLLVRILDFLKKQSITSLFTSLTEGGEALEQTNVGISSLMDTWILLSNIETNGERNRIITVLKSRGMAHSNQGREFRITDRGVQILDVYTGQRMLTGSARLYQEAVERSAAEQRRVELDHRKREFERKRRVLLAQIEDLQAALDNEEMELRQTIEQSEQQDEVRLSDREQMAQSRQGDTEASQPAQEGD